MTFAATRPVFWTHPKCICGQGSAPKPTGEAYSAPQNPLDGGRGLAALTPRTPSPKDKFLDTPVAAASNHSCCKEFRFEEKVWKHCCRVDRYLSSQRPLRGFKAPRPGRLIWSLMMTKSPSLYAGFIEPHAFVAINILTPRLARTRTGNVTYNDVHNYG